MMWWILGCVAGESAATPVWYQTCGDPDCSGYDGPFDGVSACVSETLGDACEDEGATCDPVDECNTRYICATEDPQAQTGGCPISRKEHKRDIAYLDGPARDAAAQAALDMKLSTWRYRWEPDSAALHLGFLIDDAPESPAVLPGGQRVDLYGYTSLTLAAVQVQAARVAELEAQLAARDAQLQALEARLSVLEAKAR